MTDLQPLIPLAELEIGELPRYGRVVTALSNASNHAVKYLRDYANPAVNVTTAGYLAVAEEAWSADLDWLRGQRETGMTQVKLGWAEMRIHWYVFGLSS